MSVQQVNGQPRLNATRALAAARSAGARNDTAGASVTRQPDSVSISDKARALASAQQTASNIAENREDRLKAIKAAVADGTYTVNSRTLANTLVKNYAQ